MNSTSLSSWKLKRIALSWAYPPLRQLPPTEWDNALKRARATKFDMIEWIGLLAGVVFVAYLLRFDTDPATAFSLPIRYLAQFVVAVPLLCLVVGPFYLRRTRRGLEQEVAHRAETIDLTNSGD